MLITSLDLVLQKKSLMTKMCGRRFDMIMYSWTFFVSLLFKEISQFLVLKNQVNADNFFGFSFTEKIIDDKNVRQEI